jgi:hypothetical protein
VRAKLLLFVIVLFAGTFAYGQAKASGRYQKMLEAIPKAEWNQVATDKDDIVYFVDANGMYRSRDLVVFRSKFTNHGTINYRLYVGGCGNDTLKLMFQASVYPDRNTLIDDEIPEQKVVSVGHDSVGYVLLDYVCKYTNSYGELRRPFSQIRI